MHINPFTSGQKNSSSFKQIKANDSKEWFANQEPSNVDLPKDIRSTSFFKKYIFNIDLPRTKDENGHTLLLLRAVESNSLAQVQMCVMLGADVNATADDGGKAIDTACCLGNVEIVKYLLKHGATVNHKDNTNHTALHYTSAPNLEIFKLLLEHGADVNAQTNQGRTALYKACGCCSFDDIDYEINRLKIIELLLSYGAKINLDSVNELHRTLSYKMQRILVEGTLTSEEEPFYLIQAKIIKLLLAKDADIFAYSKDPKLSDDHQYRHSPVALLFQIYIYTWADCESQILKIVIDSFLEGLKRDQLIVMQRILLRNINSENPCKMHLWTENKPLYFSYPEERCIKNLILLHDQITEMILTIENEHKTIINQAADLMMELSLPVEDKHVLKIIADYAYPVERLTTDKVQELGYSESIVNYTKPNLETREEIPEKKKTQNIFQRFLGLIYNFCSSWFGFLFSRSN